MRVLPGTYAVTVKGDKAGSRSITVRAAETTTVTFDDRETELPRRASVGRRRGHVGAGAGASAGAAASSAGGTRGSARTSQTAQPANSTTAIATV